MSKRPVDIIKTTPASMVRCRLFFDSSYVSRVAAAIVRGTKAFASAFRSMNRERRMSRIYRSRDVARGFEGLCKVESLESRHDMGHIGFVMCVSENPRPVGLTHRVGKRFCVKSVYVLGLFWTDQFNKSKKHRNSLMLFLVRDRRPVDKPQDFGEVFNMFDNEPSTATVKNVHRDRYQVLRKWHATVTGGQYASKEQALVKKFIRVNNYVVYNQQEAGKYENHTENALMLYMACTHASNPVYATLKIRIYFYDSVTN
ncbi:coat protein [Vinca leaf curl virus]|uniref:Capsid protein n=1 Tax=Vinca leaf curl virus TaxID=1170656 RepID=A0A0P0D4L2_9GEMI|nr:coat protein [Vinca leaf curl virus]ALJ03314.1 coat protein [Vinca leaf curl virus]